MAIIYTYPVKSNPVDADLVLISDSESTNPQDRTKQVTVASIKGATASGVSSVSTIAAGSSSGVPIVVTPTTGAVTIQSMAFAGDTNVGHVPDSSAAPAGSFLKADGSWTVPPDTNTTTINLETSGTSGAATWNSSTNVLNIPQYAGTPYTLPLATSSVRGGVKIGATGLAAKNYAIELDGNERMYVAVPWTDTNTTDITLTTTGTSGASTWNSGTNTLNIPQYANTTDITLTTTGTSGASTWNGTTLNIPQYADTTYSAATSSTLGLVKLRSDVTQTVAANAPSAEALRTYGIQNNASGQMVVNVPWVSGTSSGGESGGFPSTIPAASTASFTAAYNNFHKVETSASNQNIVVTLPTTATVDKTKIIGIKWTAEQGGGVSNTVTIKTPGAGVTIDGDTNSHTTGLALGAVNNYYELITDGADWWIK